MKSFICSIEDLERVSSSVWGIVGSCVGIVARRSGYMA
jgi:hypothetical protein